MLPKVVLAGNRFKKHKPLLNASIKSMNDLAI
jgi:hypothetical protein